MTSILVGSNNPVKIAAVEQAFAHYYDNVSVEGVEVTPSVPDQPKDEENFTGARDRALDCKQINQDKALGADFFVGIEGGVIHLHNKWFITGVVCVVDTDSNISYGIAPMMELPETIAKRALQGEEIGVVMDELTGDHNTKQKDGCVGFLTKNVVSRTQALEVGVIMALTRKVHPNL